MNRVERMLLYRVLITVLVMAQALAVHDPVHAETTSGSGSGRFIHVSAKEGAGKAAFGTLEAARDEVRRIKAEGLPPGGITVLIEPGEYLRSNAFELTREDSGTTGSPITWRAAEDDAASLVGGKMIKPDAWQALGAEAAKRIHPKVNAKSLVTLDVKAMGLGLSRTFAPKPMFTAEWYILDLFANDKRQPNAQWPNPNENIRGVNEAGWTTCNGSIDNRSFSFGKGGQPEDQDLSNEMEMDGTQRAHRWTERMAQGHELWLKGFWRTPWSAWIAQVESIDPGADIIRLKVEPQGGMGSKYTTEVSKAPLYRKGSGTEKWQAINLLEEIDEPGEWALDTKDQKLYWYPPGPVATLRVMISDLDKPLIRVQDARHLRFEGLRLRGGMSHGIELLRSQNITVAGCSIEANGDCGIRDEGGYRNTYQSNDLHDQGGFGMAFRRTGDRARLLPAQTRVINNHIHHVGQLKLIEAVRIEQCIGLYFAHNLFHDIPRNVVRDDDMNDSVFEYNEAHNNALKESDMGVFYGYGGWSTYGNVFRYNFSHHTIRSNGVYRDDGDSGDVAYHNIIQGAITGIKIGGGHDNLNYGNLLVECKNNQIDDRGIARNYRLGTAYETKLKLMRPDQEPWKSYGLALMKEFGFRTKLWTDVLDPAWMPEYPNGSSMTDNVAVACGPFAAPQHGNVRVSGNLEIKTVAEAGFRDYANMDLRTENRQILEKFPKLNEVWPRLGLQLDAYRKTVPTRAQTGGLADRNTGGDAGQNEDKMTDRIKPQ